MKAHPVRMTTQQGWVIDHTLLSRHPFGQDGSISPEFHWISSDFCGFISLINRARLSTMRNLSGIFLPTSRSCWNDRFPGERRAA